jgi:hypothetical protein
MFPNLYLNQSEINQIKANISASYEPWKSAHTKFMQDANWSLTNVPLMSVVDNGGGNIFLSDPPYTQGQDGINNPESDRHDWDVAIRSSDTIFKLGLAYQLTNDEKYANRALEHIRHWYINPETRVDPGIGNIRNQIDVYTSLPQAFYGIDLLWNYPGFTQSEKTTIQNWAKLELKFVQELANNDQYMRGYGHNNWENARIAYQMVLAHFATDQTAFLDAVERWKDMTRHINESNLLTGELGRTLSLTYSMMATSAINRGAEIARHNGIDLYSYRNSQGKGLQNVFDAHAPYLLNPSSWPFEQITTYQGIYVHSYEIAYTRYKKDSYKNVIEHFGRPIRYDRIGLGPTTLAFGSSFSGQQAPIILSHKSWHRLNLNLPPGNTQTYTLRITESGLYELKAIVKAPTTSQNSFLINVNNTPESPAHIWDISDLTQTFQERVVSHRGSGTETKNEFTPKLFQLERGDHLLFITSRERNTQLHSLRFNLVSIPTPGDLNGDGKVDIFDYQELIKNFGKPWTIFDYQKLIQNFGK